MRASPGIFLELLRSPEAAELAGCRSGAAGGYTQHPKARALLRTKPQERRADLKNGNPQTPVDIFFEYLDSRVTDGHPTQ